MSTEPHAREWEPPGTAGEVPKDSADLARAISRDVGGFNRLVAQHWAAVASYSARFLGVSDDVGEDVAQEVFLRVWAGEVSWSGTVSPRPFLLGVARNLCRNRSRHLSLRARLASRLQVELRRLGRSPTPLECLQEAELKHRLDSALQGMPARRRETFLLIRVQGLSYAEAAEVMGVSSQTVANQMSAALEELRAVL